MNIEARKLSFIESFLHLKSETVLAKLEGILNAENNETAITLEEYTTELNQANSRIEKGSFYTSNEVENLLTKWK